MPTSPVTLVVGPEELLVERAVADIVARVTQADAASGAPGVEVVDLPAAAVEASALDEMLSPSLFGDRRVVVVRGLQDAADALVKALTAYVGDPADDIALILVHKGGARGRKLLDAATKAGAVTVACAEVKKRGERLSFISSELRRHKRRTTDDAAETLLEAVGNDLRALAAACSQLVSDTTEQGGTIDADVVRRYHAGRAEVTGFAVADRAVEGQVGPALAALRWALQTGTDPVLVTSALASALRSIVRYASAPRGLRPTDLARELAMPPWKVDVVRRQSRGWSPEAIAAALTEVARADGQVKGGGADAAYAVERAVRRVAQIRAAA